MAAWCLSGAALVFTQLLVLWKSCEVCVKADDISDKHVGRTLSKKTILYDVSQIIRNNENPNQSEILSGDLYVREVNTSTNYYFIANGAAEDDYCWMDMVSSSYRCYFFGIKGIAIMFNDKANNGDALTMKDMRLSNTNLVNLLKMYNSSVDSVTILLLNIPDERTMWMFNRYLVEWLKIRSMNQSIKIGVEYSDNFLELLADEWFPPDESVDHTVLRINVSPLSTMLSYEKFFEKMERLVQKNRQVGRLNPHCTQYIRLHNENWNGTKSQHNDVFNALMSKYLYTFAQQNIGDEKYILIPTSKQLPALSNKEFFRERVTLLLEAGSNLKLENLSSQQLHLYVCGRHQMLKLLLSNVQNVILDDPHLSMLGSLLAPCNASTGKYFYQPINSSLSLILEGLDINLENQVAMMAKMLFNNTAGIRISRVCMDAKYLQKTANSTKVLELLQSQDIDACCHIRREYYDEVDTENISAIVGETIQQCGTILNLTNGVEVVQPLQVVIKEPNDVLAFLSRLHDAKQFFERLYPAGTLTPKIDLRISGKRYVASKEESFYCETEVKQAKEYWQTIYSFASIHRWSIIMPLSYYNPMSVWQSVKSEQQIDKYKLAFPLLFRTNAPLAAGEDIPMTYPCIKKTLDASQSRINFLENQYSGVTFQTNLHQAPSLSTKELHTTLQLAMTRFPCVELVVASREDLKVVLKAVLTDPPRFRNPPNLTMPILYVQVPLADAHILQPETLVSNNHTAIHFSNWESLTNEQWNTWEGFQYTLIPNLGLSVGNCIDEMNSGLASLKRLPFLPKVNYVVCNVAPVIPNNLQTNRMNKYFGTLFYTKSYMENFLSLQNEAGNGVEVMFRLNYNCSKENDLEKFLRFLNDVNQHSAAYKIRYFLVRAFEAESSSTE